MTGARQIGKTWLIRDEIEKSGYTKFEVKEDFSQYELEDKKLRLKSIYDIIPAELNKQNKKFVFTMLDKELKFDRYENSFLRLKDAGVALPVYNVDAPVIPLMANKSSNVFRPFSGDIGLLTSAYPAETKIELINKNGEMNNGAHFENVVAQQLTANGFEPYFCKKKNIGEMDFAIKMSMRNRHNCRYALKRCIIIIGLCHFYLALGPKTEYLFLSFSSV